MTGEAGGTRTFEILPAIDVLEGRCVRLAGGERSRVTIEGGDPAEAALRFVAEGATFLHLVDLDGAFSGRPTGGLLERIVTAAAGTPVQVGGGYRTLGDVDAALAAGAARVMVGTSALSPTFLREATVRFGERLMAAVDARDGFVVAEGWTHTSALPAPELARACANAGVRRLLVTSTARDGSLAGPDLELLGAVVDASRLPVLAAGGIASLDDLGRLRSIGCAGAVLGSALWRGRISLADAMQTTLPELK
jgi:phosphoribosylformimino-5-aminoimidazole carboxamide ribotide isomerase